MKKFLAVLYINLQGKSPTKAKILMGASQNYLKERLSENDFIIIVLPSTETKLEFFNTETLPLQTIEKTNEIIEELNKFLKK